jgi:hypothetical protein
MNISLFIIHNSSFIIFFKNRAADAVTPTALHFNLFNDKELSIPISFGEGLGKVIALSKNKIFF